MAGTQVVGECPERERANQTSPELEQKGERRGHHRDLLEEEGDEQEDVLETFLFHVYEFLTLTRL